MPRQPSRGQGRRRQPGLPDVVLERRGLAPVHARPAVRLQAGRRHHQPDRVPVRRRRRTAWTTPGGRRPGSIASSARASPEPYVQSGTYVKLRELDLSYNLPHQLVSGRCSAASMRKARLSLTGRNLLRFTPYRGLDPEVSNFGRQAIVRNIDVAPFPPSRSFFLSDRPGVLTMTTIAKLSALALVLGVIGLGGLLVTTSPIPTPRTSSGRIPTGPRSRPPRTAS